MSLHLSHSGSCFGSREGTHTCPHSASRAVPMMRASSTLAAASSPGLVLTMWAIDGSAVSTTLSVSGWETAGRVCRGVLTVPTLRPCPSTGSRWLRVRLRLSRTASARHASTRDDQPFTQRDAGTMTLLGGYTSVGYPIFNVTGVGFTNADDDVS